MGKKIINKEVEYEWKLKKLKTEYKISISNAYRKGEKPSLGESFIKYSFSNQTFLRIVKLS